ncbi:sensor histidine kinase [Hyalangium versicolor]|uniref:sensor histidine kinase n=1 Tax=Hyalangium versicolor TaxID=2861190 RepID=UPI001CCE7A79|nr:ATP-binding protein [Hyalangium versicolor]
MSSLSTPSPPEAGSSPGAKSQTPELPDADPEQVHRGIQAIAGLGPLAVNISIFVWFWGQWTKVLAVLAVAVVLTAANVWLLERLAKRVSREVVETVRMLLNVAGCTVSGHFTRWSPLVWVFIAYNLLWFHGLDRWVRPRVAVYLVLINALALWDGSAPVLALAFSLLGFFGYLLTERRDSLLRGALKKVLEQRARLEKAQEEMRRMHSRAIEQEKLSSLGMMAAGVAHEINNPMSFVASNAHQLLKDLQQEPTLPESLKEHRDEVLPATLEGIKRVNAIVADLRRFARGDPEAFVEYDLNAEVRMALRIAHSQLRHCQVESELGEVGPVVGRSRQIGQVLVNLLVNAGQATAERGVVRISTKQQGEWVRIEIRDTGTGMSPETLRNLFQPFFTTKPPGTGMGLGLAVVHGIVTSHGGRIAVESQVGKGTCFLLSLPRMPPEQPYAASAVEVHHS